MTFHVLEEFEWLHGWQPNGVAWNYNHLTIPVQSVSGGHNHRSALIGWTSPDLHRGTYKNSGNTSNLYQF